MRNVMLLFFLGFFSLSVVPVAMGASFSSDDVIACEGVEECNALADCDDGPSCHPLAASGLWNACLLTGDVDLCQLVASEQKVSELYDAYPKVGLSIDKNAYQWWKSIPLPKVQRVTKIFPERFRLRDLEGGEVSLADAYPEGVGTYEVMYCVDKPENGQCEQKVSEFYKQDPSDGTWKITSWTTNESEVCMYAHEAEGDAVSECSLFLPYLVPWEKPLSIELPGV